jgi:hypothetical protein
VDLVQHLPVLRGREHARDGPGLLLQGMHHGRQLDCLGAGTDDDQDAMGSSH